MGFVACVQCGNSNRDTDTNCYSCGAELVLPPPAPPQMEAPPPEDDPWAANRDLRVQPLSPTGGADPNKGRFRDLASRYEAKAIPKTDANVLHGIRSGVPAGLLVGVLMGFYRKSQSDELTRLVLRRHPKTPKHGSEIFAYSVGFDLFLGLALGIFLGLTNLLCYTPESGIRGAILGALAGGGLCFYVGAGYVGILVGAVQGFLMGILASLIERKLYRGGK